MFLEQIPERVPGEDEVPVATDPLLVQNASDDAVLPFTPGPREAASESIAPVSRYLPDEIKSRAPVARREPAMEALPADDQVPAEILEFFVAEAEEHLQVVTQCLLRLETSPSQQQINRLSRAIHTVKGSAAQVGLHRIAHVAHRVEDLIGHLRDGELQPSAEIIDICLDSVDVLKKFRIANGVMKLKCSARCSHCWRASCWWWNQRLLLRPRESDGPVTSAFDPEEEKLLAEYAAAREIAAELARAEAEKHKEESQRKERQAAPQSSQCVSRWTVWTA